MSALFIYIVMILLGAVFGSFAGAQVWRLRARQLSNDKAHKEPYDKKEYKKLLPLIVSTKDDRSRCLDCRQVLQWYDLIPLVSWLSTKGKCRHCKRPIGAFEPLMEVGVAVYFLVSYIVFMETLTSPIDVVQFLLWLVAGVLLAILFAYDKKWFLLPDTISLPLIGISFLYAALGVIGSETIINNILNILWAVMIFGGLYFVLWLVSRGRWIGFGDVKLGISLGLLLGTWELAVLGLFLANLIGVLMVLPGLITGKLSRSSQIPFGPLMIMGFFIAATIGDALIDGYVALIESIVFALVA